MMNSVERVSDGLKFKLFRPMLLKIGNLMGRHSEVGDKPVFDNQLFKWSGLLEENWEAIRDEIQNILEYHDSLPNLQDIQREQEILNQDDKWKSYFLYGFGIKASQNCKSCPITTSVLEQIPGMKTAFFSILSPNKHIPAHRGIFKGFIRSHLGLIIPGKTGDCVMRIEDQYIQWREGNVVIFDDTYDHEVWNNTSEKRVVLLVDVIRPFKFPLNVINNAVIWLLGRSSYVKGALKNYKSWESNFHSGHIYNSKKFPKLN